MVELTRPQRVNRFVEEAFSGKQPCQWAVFPRGTVLMLSGMSLSSQAFLGAHARDVLDSCGIEDAFDGIQFLYGSILAHFTAANRDWPRGVRVFGVFPSIATISSRRAIKDWSMGFAPVVVYCNTPLPPSIPSPGDHDEEESDDEDSVIDLSDDTHLLEDCLKNTRLDSLSRKRGKCAKDLEIFVRLTRKAASNFPAENYEMSGGNFLAARLGVQVEGWLLTQSSIELRTAAHYQTRDSSGRD